MNANDDLGARLPYVTLRRRQSLRNNLLQGCDFTKVDCPAALKDALKHNDVPSKFTIQLAQRLRTKTESDILDAETRILTIDEQIFELQREKDSLVKKISPSWAKLRVCDTVLSLFRRVPAEILQDIASYAKPSQPSLDTREAPMLLAHVCRTWRRATFNLPTLWKELYLELDFHSAQDGIIQRYTDIVQAWFKRTGSHYLSLHLYTPSGSRDIEANRELFKKHFIRPLRSIFLRVQHLGIGAPWVVDFLPLFQDNAAKNLQSLTIKNSHQHNFEPLSRSPSPFHNIDKLILDAPICYSGFAQTTFPWSRITALVLCEWIDVDQYVKILAACQNLITGTFSLLSDSESILNEVPQEPPKHVSMENLSLSIYDPLMSLTKVLLMYDLQYMTTLEISHISEMVHDDETIRFPMCLIGLERLSVVGDWSDSIEVLSGILECTPYLEDLHLSLAAPAFLTLEMLSVTEIPPSEEESESSASDSDGFSDGFLPYLDSISLHIPSNNPVDPIIPDIVESLEKMLSARASASTRLTQLLRSFRISTRDTRLRRQIQRTVQPFVKLGLEFELFSTPQAVTPEWCQKGPDEIITSWQEGIDKRQELKRQGKRKQKEMIEGITARFS